MKTLGNCNGLSGLHLALVLIGPRVRGGTRGSRGNSIQGGGGSPTLSFFSFNRKGVRGKLKSNPLFRHKKGLEGVWAVNDPHFVS